MPTSLVAWLAEIRKRQTRNAQVRAEIERKHPAESVREQLEQAEERAFLEGFTAALDELTAQLRAEAKATLEALPEAEA